MISTQLNTAEALIERRGQCTLLANVLLMTENMLRHARSDEWDTVTELERDRRALLKECFAEVVPPEHSEIFAEALAAMLHLNEELMALLEDAKAVMREKQAGINSSHRGIGHYLDIARP